MTDDPAVRPTRVLSLGPSSGTLCLAALLSACLAACSGDTVVRVAPPVSPEPAVTACRGLHAALPATVEGLRRRATEPVSDLTAAWGDPAIVLRCGVPRPQLLTSGSATYDPTADVVGVNGVDWLIERRSAGYRFTTVRRVANVELTVPKAYTPETNPLVDLATAVAAAVPLQEPVDAPGAGSTAGAS